MHRPQNAFAYNVMYRSISRRCFQYTYVSKYLTLNQRVRESGRDVDRGEGKAFIILVSSQNVRIFSLYPSVSLANGTDKHQLL